ncbi:hypothetical protein [Syntrophomonas erecta]
MIQAGHGYATNWDIDAVSAPTKSTRQVKRVYTRRNTHRAWLIKIGICIFIYALVLVYLCIRGAVLGYQIVSLENDIRGLETANHRMEYEVEVKTSLEHIEQVASTQMGMVKPEKGIAMAVTAKPYSSSEVNSVKAKVSEEKPQLITAESNQILHKIYSNLMLLAEKNI